MVVPSACAPLRVLGVCRRRPRADGRLGRKRPADLRATPLFVFLLLLTSGTNGRQPEMPLGGSLRRVRSLGAVRRPAVVDVLAPSHASPANHWPVSDRWESLYVPYVVLKQYFFFAGPVAKGPRLLAAPIRVQHLLPKMYVVAMAIQAASACGRGSSEQVFRCLRRPLLQAASWLPQPRLAPQPVGG